MTRYATWGLLGLFGLAAFILALDFGWGSGSRIGSAPLPLLLSGLLVLVSAWGFLVPGRAEDTEGPPEWRPFAAVVGGVVLFILLIELVGLIPTILACMGAAYLGQTERHFTGFLIYAVGFAVAAWLLFSLGLGLPVPAFGS